MTATSHPPLRTLVLSLGFEPVKAIGWQRAITLVYLNKAEIVDEYEAEVRSPSTVIRIPAVIRLMRTFKRVQRNVKFSKKNVYLRDRGRCQYCGKPGPLADMTYDHVLPRSHGGKTDWLNISLACPICNRAKANRTPEQAGMKLLNKPVRPTWLPTSTLICNGSMPAEWQPYLAAK